MLRIHFCNYNLNCNIASELCLLVIVSDISLPPAPSPVSPPLTPYSPLSCRRQKLSHHASSPVSPDFQAGSLSRSLKSVPSSESYCYCLSSESHHIFSTIICCFLTGLSKSSLVLSSVSQICTTDRIVFLNKNLFVKLTLYISTKFLSPEKPFHNAISEVQKISTS